MVQVTTTPTPDERFAAALDEFGHQQRMLADFNSTPRAVARARNDVMALYEAKVRECERLADVNQAYLKTGGEYVEALAVMTQRAEAAERDALRYRWLRLREVEIQVSRLVRPESSERLDEAIDRTALETGA
jgi:hypothetical protein